MRFDLISVFPEFFSVLDLSLVGKARERGIVELHTHDLRDWTDDVHRTVDDTPAGGGAGMVMKPDVWARAIDSIVGGAGDDEVERVQIQAGGDLTRAPESRPAPRSGARTVLAIPTPSGYPLTQADCARLAHAEHVIVACGRYEGIDARVAEYYRDTGVEVFEYSLGDYVLNGGEVAAIALVEAVARLLPGMVGNPESLIEESHGVAGLLEYPVYTRPTDFRGYHIPDVLLSGNHGAVSRWRRDQALLKTSRRRPDMVERLAPSDLDKKDRRTLLEDSWIVVGDESPQKLTISVSSNPRYRTEPKLSELSRGIADLAARTFPDACPKDMPRDAIDAFVAQNLSDECFYNYALDDDALVVGLWAESRPVAYSLVLYPQGDDDVRGREDGAPVDFVDGEGRDGPLIYMSKFYVDREFRGTGLAQTFMHVVLGVARGPIIEARNPYIWLGTNPTNRRAMKFYTSMGFTHAGEREFRVGDQINLDPTFVRSLFLAE